MLGTTDEPVDGEERKLMKAVENGNFVAVPFEQTEWYRDIKASMTAGDTVKADRGLRGWTQKVLAQKLGISVQNLSEIERDVRPVSRKMAAKLAEVFDTDPAAYFRFV